MSELINGWYFCNLKQNKKQSSSDPDIIQDWIERVNGAWNLHAYSEFCTFVSVIMGDV